MASTPPSLREALDRDGFVVLPSLLSSDSLSSLRQACSHITQLARAGKWPHIRTLPKQFPPWPAQPGPEGIWGVQHLLHPDLPLPKGCPRDVFQRSYFSDGVVGAVAEIVGCEEVSGGREGGKGAEERGNGDMDGTGGTDGEENGGADGEKSARANGDRSEEANGDKSEEANGHAHSELVMELYNLLVRPDSDFSLRWHRDDIPAEATPAEERARLCPEQEKLSPSEPSNATHSRVLREYAHAQWNLALFPDSSLIVVPGSHKRARTQREYEILARDPWAAEVPGQMVVQLQPGDVVFYDNNILHRGVYEGGKERMTLHGSMSRKDKAQERARNVLQHGVGEWVDRCDFETLDPSLRWRAEGMRARLVEMGRGRKGKKVEYSQPD